MEQAETEAAGLRFQTRRPAPPVAAPFLFLLFLGGGALPPTAPVLA